MREGRGGCVCVPNVPCTGCSAYRMFCLLDVLRTKCFAYNRLGFSTTAVLAHRFPCGSRRISFFLCLVFSLSGGGLPCPSNNLLKSGTGVFWSWFNAQCGMGLMAVAHIVTRPTGSSFSRLFFIRISDYFLEFISRRVHSEFC